MKPKPQAPGPSPAHLGRAQARAVAEKSLVFGESMEVSVVTGSTCVPGTVINVDKFRRELPGGLLVITICEALWGVGRPSGDRVKRDNGRQGNQRLSQKPLGFSPHARLH